MSERFSPTSRCRLCACTGPLIGDLAGFAAELAAQGYAAFTAERKLRLVKDLSGWLDHQGLGVDVLDEQLFRAFLCARRVRRLSHGEATTGKQLLRHLRERGRVPAAPAAAGHDGPIGRIEHAYEHFLVHERGLSPATVHRYLSIVHLFLTERFGTRAVMLETLVAREVNRFVLRHAGRLSRSHAKLLVTALRSFLRHLYRRGDLRADLARAVLPVMHWRRSGLPRALPPGQVERIIESCDLRTATGRRNRAILLLLARLGLRAGEVARMTLDDLDWNRGVVIVSGKGQRREPLPLTREVGEALAAYLRCGRPPCSTRRLFVTMRPPYRGFAGTTTVRDVVRRSMARIGIDAPFKGSHLMRHSLATAMLRHGASLEDIGQVLRHRHPETTQIDAKVDLEALRALAPAWPGGAA